MPKIYLLLFNTGDMVFFKIHFITKSKVNQFIRQLPELVINLCLRRTGGALIEKTAPLAPPQKLFSNRFPCHGAPMLLKKSKASLPGIRTNLFGIDILQHIYSFTTVPVLLKKPKSGPNLIGSPCHGEEAKKAKESQSKDVGESKQNYPGNG